MVRILSNGDIVQDDHPPAAPQGSPGQVQPDGRPRRGFVQPDGGQAQYHMPQTGSMFESLNQRLLDGGLPRWNLGSHTVEPIVTVGLVLAFFMLGFKGLILGAVLFFVSKWSQGGGGGGAGGWGGAPAQRFQAPPGGGGGGGGGYPGDNSGAGANHRWTGGHRLGR